MMSICKSMPSGAGLQKNLPHDQLWPEIAKFIVNLHRISVPDAMERSDLALDAPDDSDTPDSG